MGMPFAIVAAWAALTFLGFSVACILFFSSIFVARRRGHQGLWWAMYVLGLHAILSRLYGRLGGLEGKASKLVAWVYHLLTLPMACEIPLSVKLGRSLRMAHTAGIVFNWVTQIGDGCVIMPGVVIGGNGRGGVPRIGDNVFIGANAVLVGDINIGSHSTIGAGAVVVDDVPDFALVVGDVGKIVKLPYHRPYYDHISPSVRLGGT